jgi:DNA-binding CsgD family transcriptional regulator
MASETRARSSELLEREREIVALDEALEAARTGEGRFVLVEGPAGIGKSALLAVARARAHESGCRVLSASGGELETEFPYGVVRQLFAPALVEAPAAEDLFVGAAALARPVLALEAARDGARGERDSSALEGLHGLYWLTVNLASKAPMVIAVDDGHWSDGASLRFLLYVRRRLEGLPLLLLVATRPGEPKSDEPLLRLLAAEGRPKVLRPGTLSPDAVAAMLRTGLAERPAPAFTEAAHAATGGNPFLVRELVADLADRRVRPTTGAAARLPALGVRGVTPAVLRRLAALGEGATALARAIAVLGGGAEPRHAAALAGLGAEASHEIIEALVRVQILRDARALSFVHPLVRAAIYLDIPAPARARAHADAARILSQAGAEADEIAAHLLEADPEGDAAVVEQLRVAARNAAAKGAMDVAATYLRRALAEPPTADQRSSVMYDLGKAELASGQPDAAAERLASAAADADDLDTRIGIVLMRRHALVLADRIPEAVAVVDEVRGDVRDPGLGDLLEAGGIGAGLLDFAAVRDIEDRLVRLRARAADPALREPLALAVAAASAAFANRPVRETTALAERSIAALPQAHAASVYSIQAQLGGALYLAERFDELAELASGWLDEARRRGSLPSFIAMSVLRSIGAYRVGALQDAESDARDALEAARLYGHRFWLPGAVAALLDPLLEHGRLDEAEEALADTRADSYSFCSAILLPARGRLRVAQGRLREGLDDLLACGERYESAANRSPSLWAWRSQAALAIAAIGDQGRAGELAAEELRLARELGAPRALGVALRAAGLVAEGDEGLALLKDAVDVLAGSGAALEQARALTDFGAVLRRGGRRADARQPLREGLELAVRCGAGVLAERARDELLATGAHPRRERLSGPEALTPSELRVARMAAAGRSNPDIAQALFLTRRTVETHLTHAYQKLDIRSRDELAGALGEAA